MPIDSAQVLREALDIWQNPPYTELSRDAQVDAANRCIQQRYLDMGMAPASGMRLVTSDAFTFPAGTNTRICGLSTFIDDTDQFLSISRVEYRSATSTYEDDWQEVVLSSYENWSDVMRRNDALFCCVVGPEDADGDGLLRVSFDPTNFSFRCVYKTQPDTTRVDGQIEMLPDAFRALLVYDVAIEFGELIDNQSPEFQTKKATKMKYLLLRQQDTLARFDKWRRSQRGQSVATRRAFNDRGTSILGRRGFWGKL